MKEVLRDVCPEIKQNLDQVKVMRLGKKPDKSSGRKPRPVKIIFSDSEAKETVVSQARKLRNHDKQAFRKMVIVPDKTQKQRDEDRKLYIELKRQREEEGLDVIIRNGKIIPRPKTSQNDSDRAGASKAPSSSH